jgi:hypothetical protein
MHDFNTKLRVNAYLQPLACLIFKYTHLVIYFNRFPGFIPPSAKNIIHPRGNRQFVENVSEPLKFSPRNEGLLTHITFYYVICAQKGNISLFKFLWLTLVVEQE